MRKALTAVAVFAVLLIAAAGAAVWLIVRDDVSRLRAIEESNRTPLPPMVRAAFVAEVNPRLKLPDTLVRRGLENRALSAFVITHLFTPDELLRIYAHSLYMGRGVLGVESAARVNFAKHLAELTTAEAAMLAAMSRSPNVLSPIRYPERALDRRNKLLERMHRLGFIDAQQFRDAVAEPLRTHPRRG